MASSSSSASSTLSDGGSSMRLLQVDSMEQWDALVPAEPEMFALEDEQQLRTLAYEVLLLNTHFDGDITNTEMELLMDEVRVELKVPKLRHVRLFQHLQIPPPISLGTQHAPPSRFVVPLYESTEQEAGIDGSHAPVDSLYHHLLLLWHYTSSHFESHAHFQTWATRQLSLVCASLILHAHRLVTTNGDFSIDMDTQTGSWAASEVSDLVKRNYASICKYVRSLKQNDSDDLQRGLAGNLQTLERVLLGLAHADPDLRSATDLAIAFPINTTLYGFQLQCVLQDRVDRHQEGEELSQASLDEDQLQQISSVHINNLEQFHDDPHSMLKEQLEGIALHPHYTSMVQLLRHVRDGLGISLHMHHYVMLDRLFNAYIHEEWPRDLWESMRRLIYLLRETQASWYAGTYYQQEMANAQAVVSRMLTYLNERLANYHFYYCVFAQPALPLAMHLHLALDLKTLHISQASRVRSLSQHGLDGKRNTSKGAQRVDATIVVDLIQSSMRSNFARLVENYPQPLTPLSKLEELIDDVALLADTEESFYAPAFNELHPFAASVAISELVAAFRDVLANTFQHVQEVDIDIKSLFGSLKQLEQALLSSEAVRKEDVPDLAQIYAPLARDFMHKQMERVNALLLAAMQAEDWKRSTPLLGSTNGPTEVAVDTMQILSQCLPVITEYVFLLDHQLLDEFQKHMVSLLHRYGKFVCEPIMQLPDIVPLRPRYTPSTSSSSSSSRSSRNNVYTLREEVQALLGAVDLEELGQRLTNLQFMADGLAQLVEDSHDAIKGHADNVEVVEACHRAIVGWEELLSNNLCSYIVWYVLRKPLLTRLYVPSVSKGMRVREVLEHLNVVWDGVVMACTDRGVERIAALLHRQMIMAFERVLTDSPAALGGGEHKTRWIEQEDVGALEKDWAELQDFFGTAGQEGSSVLVERIDRLLLVFGMDTAALRELRDTAELETRGLNPQDVLAVLAHRRDGLRN